MIRIEHLTKKFDTVCAVNDVSMEIPEGIMYGLLGTNGAGKSTLLRLIAGVLQADTGEIEIEGESCYDNPNCKAWFFYLPDTPYYFPNASMETMCRFYAKQYPEMDENAVAEMAEMLDLDMRQPIWTFSKGMRRQAFLILALCANTKYMLCDEVFDGLDPMVTEVMKKLIREEMKERKFTVLVVSHKLRDLEDICDQIGILHKGGLLSSGDMRERARNTHKFQCVVEKEEEWERVKPELAAELELIRCQKEGNFVTVIVRLKETTAIEEVEQKMKAWFPCFCGEVPMSLEEIFLSEMEASGYDMRKVLH